MDSYNYVAQIGRLAADPQFHDKNGTTIATFDLGVNEAYNDDDGNRKEMTTWIKVKAFDRRVESVRSLSQGRFILVVGNWRDNVWTETVYDKEGRPVERQQKRSFIRLQTFRFLDPKPTQES